MMCEWDTARFLIFSGNGEPLIYYSHITSALIFIALIGFTFLKLRPWPKNSFRLIAVSYAVWLFCDLILWANENIDHIMFFWTLLVMVEPLIFIGAYIYFLRFTENKPLSRGTTLFLTLLLVPSLVFGALGLSVIGFDATTCDRNAWEGIGVYYGFFVEALLLLLIIGKTARLLLSVNSRGTRTKLFLVSLGVSLLFVGFLSANFLATLTGDYVTSQYGHISVPMFAAFLAYITIRYESFEPRILLIDTLVTALFILLASLLFVENEAYQIYANVMAFIIMMPLSYTLLTGIRKEVRIRKELEVLTKELQATNERQETLIHFIGHEVKGFLTRDAGTLASLSEGDVGSLPEPARLFAMKGLTEARRGIDAVATILKASNLKKGTVSYEKAPFDLKEIVVSTVEKAAGAATEKGLVLSVTPSDGVYEMLGDKAQIQDHVLRNLIDNAINYTPSGSIIISLRNTGGLLSVAITDTGIGISAEDKERLFTEGGHGKDSQRMNAHSTGYGLYIAKQIAEAHGGTISVASEGAGKGSTFTVTFPALLV
jgi:signal transduction histidine kinase